MPRMPSVPKSALVIGEKDARELTSPSEDRV
jgi:hypothetical protein